MPWAGVPCAWEGRLDQQAGSQNSALLPSCEHQVGLQPCAGKLKKRVVKTGHAKQRLTPKLLAQQLLHIREQVLHVNRRQSKQVQQCWGWDGCTGAAAQCSSRLQLLVGRVLLAWP